MGDPIVGTALGLAGTLFGGEDPSYEYMDPSQKIMPEPEYEANLRAQLTKQALENMVKSSRYPEMAEYDRQHQLKLLQQQLNFLPQQLDLLPKQQDLMQGKLPEIFSQKFQQAMHEDVGRTLGDATVDLNKRGVLSSSVMSDAINKIGRGITEASAKNFQQNLGLLSDLNAGAGNILANASNMIQGAGKLNMDINAINSGLRDVDQQQQNLPYNLYNLWRTSRFGVQGTPIENKGTPPPFSGLGSYLLETNVPKLFNPTPKKVASPSAYGG